MEIPSVIKNNIVKPKNLYHRRLNHKTIDDILSKGTILPSSHIKGRPLLSKLDFVSLTEGKCVKTGGPIQMVFDYDKLTSINKISKLWQKGSKDMFLFELEHRSQGPVKIGDSIKEIVLYKNYMTVDYPQFKNITSHKRDMSIKEKRVIEIGKKHNIPVRIVHFESEECSEKERSEELKGILEN